MIDPDETRVRQGRLKIFFGYAAGVGKTYAMLEMAHQMKDMGVDVVAGYIEPHIRPATMKLVEGLECLPPLVVSYKGITLREFALRHPGVPVGIRITPDIYAGEHAKISVGGKESKFGIALGQIDQVEALAKEKNMTIDGVHLHTGSGIYDADVFLEAAERIFSVAERFPVEYIDFGGGFKVPYKPEETGTDIELLGQKLSERFNRFVEKSGRNICMMVEPGKFLVSRAGTLLVRVDWVKQTPAATFAQVDSGLCHLIRPMMYDAYQHILNVSNPDGQPHEYNVTGYICETDNFAVRRSIPEIRRGDLLAILNAGAYGYTMASVYNSRFRPPQVLVKDGKDYLLSRRETLDDLLALQTDHGF